MGMCVHRTLTESDLGWCGLTNILYLGCSKDRQDEHRVYDADIDGLVRWRQRRVLRRFGCSTHSGHQEDQTWAGCRRRRKILIVMCFAVLVMSTLKCGQLSTCLPVEVLYDCAYVQVNPQAVIPGVQNPKAVKYSISQCSRTTEEALEMQQSRSINRSYIQADCSPNICMSITLLLV